MTALLTRCGRAIDDTEPFLLAARVSLVLVLVNTFHDRSLLLFGAAACAVMFLNERLLRSPWPWFLLAAVIGTSQMSEWWLVDNHKFATTAWLATIGFARLAHEPTRVLRTSARLFVGVIFLLAFGWKVVSAPYVTGDFFRYTLLRDERFEPVAALVAGADEEQLANDRQAVFEFTSSGTIDSSLEIPEAPRTEAVALVLTHWGLVLEGAIAVVFLLPLRGGFRALRPGTLLAFCATTYAVAPVVGFGLLLLTAGLAQADGAWLRRTYVAGFVAVFAWAVVMAALTG